MSSTELPFSEARDYASGCLLRSQSREDELESVLQLDPCGQSQASTCWADKLGSPRFCTLHQIDKDATCHCCHMAGL